MEEIKVISADKDGRELREERARSRYHLRCDGTADGADINEAIRTVGRTIWALPSDGWERIFGKEG